MPQQPQMQQQPNMASQQAATPQSKYVQAAVQLLPSVQEKNPYIKEQVGHLIFDYVQMLCGKEKAPKITGMLIELPVPQIRQYLSTFEALQMRVEEANRLLMAPADESPQQQSDQAPQQAATPQSKYVQAAMKLLPFNPNKEQVKYFIFDYVQMLIGKEKAPMITSMLIDFPVPQIREYLSDFNVFEMEVEEALFLLMQELAGGQ